MRVELRQIAVAGAKVMDWVAVAVEQGRLTGHDWVPSRSIIVRSAAHLED